MGELEAKNEAGSDTEQELVTDQNTQTDSSTTTVDDKKESKNTVSKSGNIKDKLRKIISSKKFRIIAPTVVGIFVLLVLFVEPVKFAVLNIFSKTSVDFVVVDDSTLVPVEGAKITIAGKNGQTNSEGKSTIKKVRYGTVPYAISKDNYTTVKDKAKVKTGSNLVGPVKLHSEGTPVQVKVSNKLSGVSVKKFKVGIEGTQISALANDQGLAILKVPSDKLGSLSLVVSAEGFNDTKASLKLSAATASQLQTLTLTPAGKHYFLSNRNGKVGVFSANLDGSEQVEVIPGKGTDDANTELSIAPDGKYGALVSRRDEQRGPDGKLMPALYSLDLVQKTIKRIDEGAPDFNLLGWQDSTRVVYRVSYQTYTRDDNSKVKRANVANATLETLFTQKADTVYNYYEDDKKHVYFQNYDATQEVYGIISLDLDAKKPNRISNSAPFYSFRRIKPSQLFYNTENQWYELNMKTQQAKTASSQPANKNYRFSVSQDGQKMAWVEDRDGKGSIIVGDENGDNAKQITKTAKVSQIIRWVANDYIVFNTQTTDESAHYIVDVSTGTVTKIGDVFRLVYDNEYF